MKRFIAFALPALLVASCADSGTETDNPATPLKGFESSGCKNRDSGPAQQALVASSETDGLTCIEWKKGANRELGLTLRNFPVPCGETYFGRANVGADGSLQLSVFKDSCGVQRCGECIFDFEFALQSVDTDAPLGLRIGSSPCEAEPAVYNEELQLPIQTSENGSVCRRMERGALGWYAQARGLCGQANMPCGTCDGIDQTSCEEGLACHTLGNADSRCLAPCASNDDCAGGRTQCTDGSCQAAVSW